ncbi:GNAT family N-acetyltransferase [Marinomonas mediterranea]|uniref:GNAT family N-acetyltransferase n=1 Tax=Marinomonas mediterranea TaxID=119864 RepID=UPI00234AB669|nr:GNAT family N-acetyltransferase [Marinomonas mediterranea]WCN13253.1 GNAT family N-acetyltransferase [Marinomonas mediterranea]
MTIRAYRDHDYPSIVDIYNSSKLDELRFEAKPFVLLRLEEDEKRLSSLRESDIYVYEDGKVLGYGAHFGTEIRALFVCPSARRKGVGKALLKFLLSKLDGNVNLFVAKTNTPAKELYKSYGFVISDEFITEYNCEPVLANEMVRIKRKC